MANTIQVRRGTAAELVGVALTQAELGYATDTDQVWIGDGSDNWEFVMHKLFGAQSILAATTDNTPVAVTVGEGTIIGRLSGGNIVALTVAEGRALIGVDDCEAFSFFLGG